MTPINHNICLFVLNNAVKEAGKKGKRQSPRGFGFHSNRLKHDWLIIIGWRIQWLERKGPSCYSYQRQMQKFAVAVDHSPSLYKSTYMHTNSMRLYNTQAILYIHTWIQISRAFAFVAAYSAYITSSPRANIKCISPRNCGPPIIDLWITNNICGLTVSPHFVYNYILVCLLYIQVVSR